MLVEKIQLINFRCYKNKTIDFKNKAVVLLSAPNGVGKTSTIDAIEWCLTGRIGRLKFAFDSRSTNETERKMNTDGILKNAAAGENETIKVCIWLLDDDDEELCLCREQKEDVLDPECSVLTLNDSEEDAKEFIKDKIDDNFYNYHFCDVQKSFNIQNYKRTGLKDLFKDFITNYDKEKQIAANIEIFSDDVSRYIDDKEDEKTRQKDLKANVEQQLKDKEGEKKSISYPTVKFYSDEITEVVKLEKEDLVNQKKELQNCGYIEVKNKLDLLIQNDSIKKIRDIAKEVLTCYQSKSEIIQRAKIAGIFSQDDIITKAYEKLGEYNNLALKKDTIFNDIDILFNGDNNTVTEDIKSTEEEIQEKEKKVKDISSEIDLLSKNNDFLKLVLNLSENKKVLIDYRNTALKNKADIKCPICGSESFATISDEHIVEEAEKYIKQNGEVVERKSAERNNIQSEINKLYTELIALAASIALKKRTDLSNSIDELKYLSEETKTFIASAKKLQELRDDFLIEDFDIQKINEIISELDKKIIEKEKEEEYRDSYKKILIVLGYKFENEVETQIRASVEGLITQNYDVSNFTYDILVGKINGINSLLADKEILSLRESIKGYNTKIEELDNDINALRELKKIADAKRKRLDGLVEELSRQEYKQIGPVLNKYYKKLIRINSCEGVNLIQKKGGISLVDNNEKNIVNVLSNGQLSVFMLAYFFASMNARQDDEPVKLYFIDDLTACMDDVNMLAFMDLLKYQLYKRKTMDQLFFITCDKRISKLLKYKLSGREIDLCELNEEQFISEP